MEITCAAAPATFRVLIHHRPTTSLEAKFSLEYLLAAGLILKTINEECFELKHVNDPVMRDLVAKVRIVDSPAQRETPGEGPVSVQVRTQTAVYEETVSYAPGHPKNPLSWERLAAKYQACARQGGFSETTVAGSLRDAKSHRRNRQRERTHAAFCGVSRASERKRPFVFEVILTIGAAGCYGEM